jgi:hypothetical protein
MRNFGNSWVTSWETSTSKESTRIAHNQEESKKSPLEVKKLPNSKNRQIESDSREIWGQSHQPKRHKILIRDTHQKPQEILLKTPPTKSSENQHKEGRGKHFSTLRNNAEPSIHTMKVRTRSSLPPKHPSLSLDLT